MIYYQFVTIQTLLNKVCYGFKHILATWCIHRVILNKQMYTQMGHHFSYLIWEQYTFILQTSSDIIDLTGVFYQTIFQHMFNVIFCVKYRELKGDILGLGKV